MGLGRSQQEEGLADAEKGRVAFTAMEPCLEEDPRAVYSWDSGRAVRLRVDPQTCLTWGGAGETGRAGGNLGKLSPAVRWSGVWVGPTWVLSTPHTHVIADIVQQANFVQMCRSGDGERQHIPDGLVEARVGSLAQGYRLVLVLQIVLHVAHLVVHRGQLVHSDPRALLDPGAGRWRG